MTTTVTIIDTDGVIMTEKEYTAQLRQKYISKPPDGYTSDEIKEMGDEDLLDMDYFLNE